MKRTCAAMCVADVKQAGGGVGEGGCEGLGTSESAVG
jgi:hypothetical protein